MPARTRDERISCELHSVLPTPWAPVTSLDKVGAASGAILATAPAPYEVGERRLGLAFNVCLRPWSKHSYASGVRRSDRMRQETEITIPTH